jgi:hypothetical protein
MSLYKALIDFRDNENDPMWIAQEDRDGIVRVKTLVKSNRGKSLLGLDFDQEDYIKMFISDDEYYNNSFYINVAFGRGYYGDSVFIDSYYHGEGEMKEGYIFRYFSEDNLKKLESILKIARPKLSIYKENDKDEIGQYLLDNFSREADEICSTYSYEFDAALVGGLKDYVINKLCNVLVKFGVIEKHCASYYYTTVNNLIRIWDDSGADKESTILEMFKHLIDNNNMELDEDLSEDYYAYYDDANFDQASFDRTVERELDRIYEKIQEQIESGDLKLNMEIIDFLDNKEYKFDRWYDFPKEKTFGKKDPRKFKFDGIDEGKIKIILSQNIGAKGFWLNLDQLKNFLYHPELFN